MVIVKYRLINSKEMLEKKFDNRTLANDWIATNPVVVLEIESSGAAVYSRIFG